MSSERDHLADLARNSSTDLYALLSADLSPTSTVREITRAYRVAALAVHPDKNPDDPNAAAKFHDITQAHAVLTSDDLRGIFDAARAAREAKKATKEGYDKRRRDMVDELERGEKGWGKEEKEKEDLRERVLAEEGRRRRKELEEKWRKEREEREKKEEQEQGKEVERAIRVRWDSVVKGIDDMKLMDRFTEFGTIDGVTIRDGERKVRFGNEKHRRVVKTAVVVFETAEQANKAIKGFDSRQDKAEWKDWLVEWAEGKEPDSLVLSEKLSQDEMASFLREEENVLSKMVAYQKDKENKMDVS